MSFLRTTYKIHLIVLDMITVIVFFLKTKLYKALRYAVFTFLLFLVSFFWMSSVS